MPKLPDLSRFEFRCLRLLWKRGEGTVAEIWRFLDFAFDGAAAPLVSRLADMDELSAGDLREIEKRLARRKERS